MSQQQQPHPGLPSPNPFAVPLLLMALHAAFAEPATSRPWVSIEGGGRGAGPAGGQGKKAGGEEQGWGDTAWWIKGTKGRGAGSNSSRSRGQEAAAQMGGIGSWCLKS